MEIPVKTMETRGWTAILITICGIIFNFGYLYRQISYYDQELSSIKSDYVRKDVIAEQLEAMRQRLTILEGTVQRMDGKLDLAISRPVSR
jgi:Tfp pilus assembly protein PilO